MERPDEEPDPGAVVPPPPPPVSTLVRISLILADTGR